jgi:hypothetical protein
LRDVEIDKALRKKSNHNRFELEIPPVVELYLAREVRKAAERIALSIDQTYALLVEKGFAIFRNYEITVLEVDGLTAEPTLDLAEAMQNRIAVEMQDRIVDLVKHGPILVVKQRQSVWLEKIKDRVASSTQAR